MEKQLAQIEILLASKSPRRQQLLTEMGLNYRIVLQDIEESYPQDMPASKVAEYLALEKAKAVQEHLVEVHQLILASDTTVVRNGIIYGKPVDKTDAKHILSQLSDGVHEVITGVCLMGQLEIISFSDCTKVHFAPLSEAEIDYYIDSCQPYDKAGAYAIQEWIGLNKIEKIEGTYFTVVGLPCHRIYKELSRYAQLLAKSS